VISNKLSETLPAEILNLPYVMFSQAPIMSRFNSFKKADKVVVNDIKSYEVLRKYPIKLEFLLNGVNVSGIQGTNWGKNRAKYGISTDSKVILTVARLDFNKRISLLIDAFKLMKQNYTLIIVGEGPELSSLKKQARAIRSENKIFFVKPMSHDQLDEFYQMCDVFTLPSKLEAAPLVLLEALSFGKTVVTNPAPEKKFILGEFGVYTNVEDPTEYAESLVRSFSVKIDINSQEYIQHLQKFTWNNIALQYQKLFADVLQKRHSVQKQGGKT
jgi:1,2-diacylglycerol 3-alpha-glucosyltransferase